MRGFRFLGVLALWLAVAGSAGAAVRYVRLGGTDVGACTDAALPCATIQYAVDQSASGDTVRLHEGGVYFETVEILTAVGTLAIEGGWTDGFGWQHGDPAATVVDGGAGDPVFLVRPGDGTTDLRLERLTLQNGQASPYGGGIAVQALSRATTVTVTLDHVFLVGNRAGAGGGAAVRGIAGTAELRIERSRVEGNIAGEGGGVAAVADLGGTARLVLDASMVIGNEAQEWPDSASQGGAVYAVSAREAVAEVDITNSFVVDNAAREGGIYGASGGCAGCGEAATTDIDLLNATVTGNRTTGLVARSWDHGQTTVDLTNTIAWGNIYFDIEATGDHFDTEVTARYSDVQRTDIGHDATYTTSGVMLDVDPSFVDPAGDDYHLSEISDLIDAGLCGFLVGSIYLRVAPLSDADGELRPPLGQLWNCDVGADEYLPFERWVRPGGVDTGNACTAVAAPCGTAQHALDQVAAGGGRYRNIVRLAVGTYAEALTIANPLAPIFLQGGWSEDFVSRETSGLATVIDAGGAGSALSFAATGDGVDLRLESLTLRDGSAADGGGLAYTCTLGYGRLELQWVRLVENRATDSGGGLRVRPIACNLEIRIDDTLITDNSAGNGGGGGSIRIDLGATANARVRFVTIAGNDAGYAGGLVFQQAGSGKGWLFLDSTLLALNSGGAGEQDDLWIYQAGTDFVWVDAEDSDIQTVTQHGGVYVPSPTVISVNPGFADPAAGDYHLTPYSPVLDLGSCYGGSAFDCDGDPRPAVDCDMGADEYSGGWRPPLDLWITNERLDGVQVREACRFIIAGPEVVVEAGAVAELRAVVGLTLDNGFGVEPGATLTAKTAFNPACLIPWP